MPAPPATINAPVVVELESVELVDVITSSVSTDTLVTVVYSMVSRCATISPPTCKLPPMPTPPLINNAPVMVEDDSVPLVIITEFVVVLPASVIVCSVANLYNVAVVIISAPSTVEVVPALTPPLTPTPPSTTKAPVLVLIELVDVLIVIGL